MRPGFEKSATMTWPSWVGKASDGYSTQGVCTLQTTLPVRVMREM